MSAAPALPPGPPEAAAAPVSFTTRDGRRLAGLEIVPDAAHGALVVNGATGFRREFYLRFAGYAAQRGYHALVYDYRGMGASTDGPLDAEPARMSDWGRLDMPAALAWLESRCPGVPLVTVGHSVGGQLIGCMPNQARARAHLMVATSTGYWRWQRFPFRLSALLFWKLYGPLELRLRGYVPRGMLWRGDSLPRGVFNEWRSWCLKPEHFTPDLVTAGSEFAAVRAPVLSWSFTDDPIATPRAVEALLALYPNARIERRWTAPAEVGARAIGHHGFFAERHREALWRPAFDWLDARASAMAPSTTAPPAS